MLLPVSFCGEVLSLSRRSYSFTKKNIIIIIFIIIINNHLTCGIGSVDHFVLPHHHIRRLNSTATG
ncbi:hypothetical protein BDV26DRAFT_159316 [Aspergillus bertholletiae]|uniref:Uncharacterized protein n=1 Tax=Aspergillus bertholletiae TaxID=1226010 RepID=A0A5N7BD41_9EURO|nr:hypothetical protein BDV26DRAFT_159316 [Aspergillus bertholletiae]